MRCKTAKVSVRTLSKTKPKIVFPDSSSLNLPTNQQQLSKSPKKKNIQRPSTENRNKHGCDEKTTLSVKPKLNEIPFDLIDRYLKKKIEEIYFKQNFPQNIYSEKLLILSDIAESITNLKMHDDSKNYQLIFSLIFSHLYRTPPQITDFFSSIDTELYHSIDDPNYINYLSEIQNENWEELSLIYDIALAFLQRKNFNFKIAFNSIGELFKLCIYLSRSTHPIEQTKITSLLSQIYQISPKKLQSFELSIAIGEIIRVCYEDQPFAIAKVLLPFLSHFSEFFILRIDLFKTILFSLQKSFYYLYFRKEFVHFEFSFLEHLTSRKNIEMKKIVPSIMQNMISIWPRQNTQKQLAFLSEIGYLSSYIEEEFIEECLKLFLPKYSTIIIGCQAGIAEEALLLWQINDFVWFMTVRPEISYPFLVVPLFQAAKEHWEIIIRALATSVLAVLKANNEQIFISLGEQIKSLQNRLVVNEMAKAAKWISLINDFVPNKKEKNQKKNQIRSMFIGCEYIK